MRLGFQRKERGGRDRPHVGVHVTPEFWRLRQEDEENGKFQDSVVCTVRPCLQKKERKESCGLVTGLRGKGVCLTGVPFIPVAARGGHRTLFCAHTQGVVMD